ncbi:MAG TPA: hypothetical protein VF384_00625 [Planctomycetota bacterium]
MLANPVVVPLYADPMAWTLAFFAMGVEVAIVQRLLARTVNEASGLLGVLFAINLTTWFVFLIAVHLADGLGLNLPASITVLELLVVAAEMALLHSAMCGRLFSRNLGLRAITWRRALGVSIAGNLASIAASILVPLAVVWS